jgi:hypothetical protein
MTSVVVLLNKTETSLKYSKLTVILVYTEEITDNYCIFKDLLTIVDLMVVNLVWILMTIDSQLMLANLHIH